MQKAVAYARFSSDHQREESITAQLRAIHAYAERNGIQIVQEYTDEARSATTDDRPGFLQMIADIKNGLKVNLVLVHKLDRFARNRYDSAVYRKDISKAGARLVAVDQPLDDSPESIILEGVLEAMAEYYSKNLAREVMKGMKENAFVAKYNGGWVPLGYEIVDGKYTIKETEAQAIRMIFEMASHGKSFRVIAEELQKLGYCSRRGKPFSNTAIHEILLNQKYMGVYVFNRAPRRLDGKRNWHKSKNQEEIIQVPGGVPAIIDESLFMEVQEIMNKRKAGPRRKKDDDRLYILTGKIECGLCGAPCVGNSRRRTSQGAPYRYYECSAKINGSGCKNPPCTKDELEQVVADQIQDELLNNIPALTGKIYGLYLDKETNFAGEKKRLQTEIEALAARINNLLDLVEDGKADAAVIGQRLNDYHARKIDLEKKLAFARVEFPDLTKEMIEDYLKHSRDALADGLGKETKSILETFVDKIVLLPEIIDVRLRLSFFPEGGSRADNKRSALRHHFIRTSSSRGGGSRGSPRLGQSGVLLWLR